jgi:uncharacterized protein (DUF427 family)
VARADLDESALTPVEQQTFCRYKGMCAYYDIGAARQAAWSYRHAYASLAVRTSASMIVVAVNAQLLRRASLSRANRKPR